MDKGKAGRPKDGGVAARDRLAEGKEVGARADFSSEPDPSHHSGTGGEFLCVG